MPFDDATVYRHAELQLDGLPDDYWQALIAIEQAQCAPGEPAWETVDGVRQLTAGGVVFLPDESDVPSPGAVTGWLGLLVFIMAGGMAVQLAFGLPHHLSSREAQYAALSAAVSLVGLWLVVRAVRLSRSAAKVVLQTGAYLFPKALVFVKGQGVNVFPKERILSFYTAIFTRDVKRTYVRYRAAGGEEAQEILADSSWCTRLERWRTEAMPEWEARAPLQRAQFKTPRRSPTSLRAANMGVVIIAVVATLVGVGAGFFKSPPKATPARPTARTSSKPTSPPAAPLDAAPTIATLVTTYGAGLFTRPQVLALDPAGNMYVADSTGRLQQLDPSGKLVRVIPVPDRTAGSNGIHGLACSSSDALYVSRGNEVLKLSLTDGSVLSTVKAKPRVDSTQPLPDELCARGIALDASNDLYVANECTPQGMNMRVVDPHSVTKLDPRGRVLGHWNDIEGVERAMAVDGAGSLYRAYHDEMYVHAPDGRLMSKWGKSGDGLGEFPSHPVALAADGHGHVYVAFFSRRISVYDANGTWRGTFAARGQAMAFGPGGDLYVLEDDAIARYQVTLPN